MKQRLTRMTLPLGTAVILSTSLMAQAAAAESTAPAVTGTFSLDLNTHFISYGADVWKNGTSWKNPTFNPSLELNIADKNNDKLKYIVGSWWDVNDNLPGDIGDRKIQEVDVWAGASYSLEKVSFKALYQEWMYANDTERIIDLVISGTMTLNPSLTIHNRVDNNGGQCRGVVLVAGVAHNMEAGPVALSFPLNVAFCSGRYFGDEGGYAFTSIGANASLPIPFMPGKWTVNAGVTGYHTREEVYHNPDDLFLTGKIGLTLAF